MYLPYTIMNIGYLFLNNSIIKVDRCHGNSTPPPRAPARHTALDLGLDYRCFLSADFYQHLWFI